MGIFGNLFGRKKSKPDFSLPAIPESSQKKYSNAIFNLASAYCLNGDPRYIIKAALIMGLLAERYPYMSGTKKDGTHSQGMHWGEISTTESWWLKNFFTAYDLLFETLSDTYIAQKNYYVMQYSSYSFAPRNAIDEMKDFFKNEVEKNYMLLKSNISLINELIKENYTITISLQAFTSKSGSETYNMQLAERRLVVLRNFFNTYIKDRNRVVYTLLPPIVLHEDKLLTDKIDPLELHPFTTRSAYKRKVAINFAVQK